jgi:hypothetical protein
MGSKAQQITWNELEESPIVPDGERPSIPDREVFLSRLGLVEVDWGKQRAIVAVRQFIALRCRY